MSTPPRTPFGIPVTFQIGGHPAEPDSKPVVLGHGTLPVFSGATAPLVTEERIDAASGRLCIGCRHFRYEEGQAALAKERFWTTVARELAWDPKWNNPADFGKCDAHRREATHKLATCDEFEPAGKLVSFAGKSSTR